MLCRVQQFLNDHAEALGQITQSAARKQLDSLVSAMGDSAQVAVTSRTMATGETARTEALRRALRKGHMQPIAAIARLELRDVPQFEALHWPPAHEKTARLVGRARAMAAVAAEHTPVFLEHRLPVDFAAQLLAAADAVEESLARRNANGRDSAGAHGQLTHCRSSAQYVLRVLTTQVENALAGDEALLGQWKFAKRVGLSSSRPAGAVMASGDTTAAPPLAVVEPQKPAALAA